MTLGQRIEAGPVEWRQGEHVGIVGRTGSGKTYLMRELLELRGHAVFLRTKDDSIELPGFTRRRHAEAMDGMYAERILLDPEYHRQTFETYHMLERAFRQGGWTVAIDELWYVEQLGVKRSIDRLWTQGRTLGLTLLAGMQRPSQVSRFALSQCRHLFIFACEGRDADVVKDATTPRMKFAIPQIEGHDFVYYNSGTGDLKLGNANGLSAIFRQPGRNPLTLGPARADNRGRR